MTWQEGLAHLAARSPSSIKMGLSRVEAALERLGNPHRRLPALHVAGTNGKGSTCAIAAACLGTRYRTALYTSPHLERVNERFRIGGEDLDDETLGRAVAEVVAAVGREHELTYFELGTLVAFHCFAQAGVEIAVLETGLGGRLDATTACAPRVTCLTPIDFDHQEYLGSTLTAIAREKAGIVKPGVPVISSRQAPEALRVLEQAAPGLLLEGRDFEVTGTTYVGRRWRLEGLSLPLAGPHQAQNLGVALAGLEALASHGFPLEEAQVKAGVARTRWPGRFERVSGAPEVVLDGAHNPAGVRALLAALDSELPGRPLHVVFGVFADKDSEPMMRGLFPRAATLHLATLASPRSLAPAQYASLARSLCPVVSVHDGAAGALAAARAAATPGAVVLIAGSLLLVGELRPLVTR